jgi:NADP-dependent 3-hydroxy acid dehydrogenase YdfG
MHITRRLMSTSNTSSAGTPSPNSCLILGATSSISFEVVRLLLGRGVRVLATGRDELRLKELQDMGASTMQVQIDSADWITFNMIDYFLHIASDFFDRSILSSRSMPARATK